MKRLLFLIICGLSLTCRAAEEEPDKQAEAVRSVSGTLVDEKGASKGTISIKKGDVFEVASVGMGSVTLRDGENLIKVPGDSVKVTEAEGDELLASSLRIVSAKMSFPNDRRYEVKQEIKKLVKKHLESGPITPESPLKIQVTDRFLRAKAGSVMYYFLKNANGDLVQYRKTGLFLTVTYEFDGKRLEKTGGENSTITLP